MSVKIEGNLIVTMDGCVPSEIGLELARRLLGPLVVDPLFKRGIPRHEMQELLLGMLAGTVGLFAHRLTAEEIKEQLYRCKQMVEEVPGFAAQAGMAQAGKRGH